MQILSTTSAICGQFRGLSELLL